MHEYSFETHTGLQIRVVQTKLANVDFLKPLAKGTVVTPRADPDSVWWLAMHGGNLIGCVNAKEMKPGVWRMRTDIVAPEYRKQGVYAVLSRVREDYCKGKGATELNCFSSQYSRHTFERAGYVVDGDPDKDNVFMRKALCN